jgi:hypothetical protein
MKTKHKKTIDFPHCHNCEFFRWTDGLDGFCHRFPPSDFKTLKKPYFTLTQAGEWCGEFKVMGRLPPS